MKLSELPLPSTRYTQLSSKVLAVLSIRIEGTWCVYVHAVPGNCHDCEWPAVHSHGQKQTKPISEAIAKHLFHPGFKCDLPYAH